MVDWSREKNVCEALEEIWLSRPGNVDVDVDVEAEEPSSRSSAGGGWASRGVVDEEASGGTANLVISFCACET